MALARREWVAGHLETMPEYGWRCGLRSLRPELERHSGNQEFLTGLRRARRHRRDYVDETVHIARRRILALPALRAARAQINESYHHLAYAEKNLAAFERAIARGSVFHGVGAMRDRVSEMRRAHEQKTAAYWSERQRLFALRGVSDGSTP